MKNINITIVGVLGKIVFFLVVNVFLNSNALGGNSNIDLQKSLSSDHEAYNELDIKDKQEDVNDPTRRLEFRVEASEWLLKIGDIDGLQAVLPAIYKLLHMESIAEEEFINNYLKTIDPKTVKNQIVELITSDKEEKYIRTTAISMAIGMQEYFKSDEVKNLIQNEDNQQDKIGLITLLGYVGNIKDVPFLLKLVGTNPEEIGEIQVQAVNTLTFMATIQHWLNYPPCMSIDVEAPPFVKQVVLNRWNSWWEKMTETEEDEAREKSK